jgi:hypothetical protein
MASDAIQRRLAQQRAAQQVSRRAVSPQPQHRPLWTKTEPERRRDNNKDQK